MASYANQAEVLWIESVPSTTQITGGDFNPPADPSIVVSSATVVIGSGELTLTVTGTLSTGGFS